MSCRVGIFLSREENAPPCPKHPESFVSLWLLVLLLSHPRDEAGFHPWGVPPALQMLCKGLGSPLKPLCHPTHAPGLAQGSESRLWCLVIKSVMFWQFCPALSRVTELLPRCHLWHQFGNPTGSGSSLGLERPHRILRFPGFGEGAR